MKKVFGLLVVSVLIISCGSMKDADATTNAELNDWVNNRSFEIESNFAMPMNTAAVNAVLNSGILGPGNNSNQISLIGTPNYLRIEGDSIEANLPYFGERRMGGGYNSRDAGITIDGLLKDYRVETKRGMYIIRFDARDTQGNEMYSFTLNLSPNQNANMSVNSTQRTNIQFRGRVEAIEENDSEK